MSLSINPDKDKFVNIEGDLKSNSKKPVADAASNPVTQAAKGALKNPPTASKGVADLNATKGPVNAEGAAVSQTAAAAINSTDGANTKATDEFDEKELAALEANINVRYAQHARDIQDAKAARANEASATVEPSPSIVVQLPGGRLKLHLVDKDNEKVNQQLEKVSQTDGTYKHSEAAGKVATELAKGNVPGLGFWSRLTRKTSKNDIIQAFGFFVALSCRNSLFDVRHKDVAFEGPDSRAAGDAFYALLENALKKLKGTKDEVLIDAIHEDPEFIYWKRLLDLIKPR